jgi:SNARE protein 1
VAGVDLLLGSAEDEDSRPLEGPAGDAGVVSPAHHPAPAADAASAQALLQPSTVLQEELSAQLAQMAGQLRRNAEHFSTALATDQAVLRNAEEKIVANYDGMKRERVRLRDHRGRSIGTTCLTLTSVLVVTVAFVVMFFVLRFT